MFKFLQNDPNPQIIPGKNFDCGKVKLSEKQKSKQILIPSTFQTEPGISPHNIRTN